MTKNEVWSLVQIDREVRWFSRLLPREVPELTAELKYSRKPAVKLSQLISERGRAKRDQHIKDIAHDASIIRSPGRWSRLNLISQPWVTELSGKPQFAHITTDAPLTVRDKSNGEADTTFASVEEMLQIWRLD